MSRTVRCVVLDDYQGVALKFGDWRALGDRVSVETTRQHIADRTELIAHLDGAEIVVVNRERTALDEAILSVLPALRLIITNGRRNSAIDIKAARERGIIVCGTGGAGNPAAEMTWALILAACRNLVGESVALTTGSGWQSSVGMGLAGKTLGLLGLGRVGSRVAQVGLAFEMNVMAWTPSLTAERAAGAGVARASDMDELFAESDIVSIHVPLNAATNGMVGHRQLGAMKPGSILVNTARYGIVDPAALIEVLDLGTLRAAAFDVFDEEPLPADHPVRALPNVLLTPHLGYVTDDNYRAYYGGAVSIIARWLDGDVLADCAL